MTAHAVPLTAETLAARLEDSLDTLGIALAGPDRTRLLRLLDLLRRWNGVFNLTAIRDVADMLPAHLLDSLSILPLVDRHATTSLLDVGSGAGFPGIPLAIVRPALQVTTVDAVAKKIGFQQQAKADLTLSNLHPIAQRVEALALPERPSLIVSRAYASIPDMLASVEHLVDPDVMVIAMKGIEPHDEIARLPAAWTLVEVAPLEVPYLGAQRCAVVLRRAAAAPEVQK